MDITISPLVLSTIASGVALGDAVERIRENLSGLQLPESFSIVFREENLPIEQATIAAARLRLRPILMTTVTTVLGPFPLALGLGASLQAVVIGGLLASTFITLVLIPAVYVSSSLAPSAPRPGRRDA